MQPRFASKQKKQKPKKEVKKTIKHGDEEEEDGDETEKESVLKGDEASDEVKQNGLAGNLLVKPNFVITM